MGIEVELKLSFPRDALERIAQHPRIAAGTPEGPPKILDNTYFDTPALELHQNRVALRIRKTPTSTVQTIKCAAPAEAGLSSRPEWEHAYSGEFDFAPVDNDSLRDFLNERRETLVPVFQTRFERRTWRVDLGKKVSVWVMIDSGTVISGDKTMPISEVELELAHGDPADLLDFAIALASELPLIPDNRSKAERGFQLFHDQTVAPQKAGPSPLQHSMTTYEGFLALAQQGQAAWQANLLGSMTSDDQEFVHQYRVSLRRLNTLLKVFETALPRRMHGAWTDTLKTLAQCTGDARDLDVMRRNILEPIAADPQASAMVAPVLAACDAARSEAQTQFDSLQYGAPLLGFAQEIWNLPRTDFPKNLARFAEKRLGERHTTAVKRLNTAVRALTPENVHRFRIALKHLRYACEFFAPLFDEEEMLQYAKAVANLQDEFGGFNDFHVALDKLDQWVAQGRIDKAARRDVAAWHRPHTEETLKRALPLSEQVLGRCQPWCTACEQRGLSSTRRRLKGELVLRLK